MTMHDPILVPVDFSECAASALTFAGELARSRSKPLVVLHVVHGWYAESDPRHPSIPMAQIAQERLQRFLEELAERNPGLEKLHEVRTVLVSGLPVNRILEVAEREGADMIIMGSHGRNGFSRLMMGSVAEAVKRRCRLPVTIVKNGEPPEVVEFQRRNGCPQHVPC